MNQASGLCVILAMFVKAIFVAVSSCGLRPHPSWRLPMQQLQIGPLSGPDTGGR